MSGRINHFKIDRAVSGEIDRSALNSFEKMRAAQTQQNYQNMNFSASDWTHVLESHQNRETFWNLFGLLPSNPWVSFFVGFVFASGLAITGIYLFEDSLNQWSWEKKIHKDMETPIVIAKAAVMAPHKPSFSLTTTSLSTKSAQPSQNISAGQRLRFTLNSSSMNAHVAIYVAHGRTISQVFPADEDKVAPVAVKGSWNMPYAYLATGQEGEARAIVVSCPGPCDPALMMENATTSPVGFYKTTIKDQVFEVLVQALETH